MLHEHWSLDVLHLNHLGSFLNLQNFWFYSKDSDSANLCVQEALCLLARLGNYLVAGRGIDAVPNHMCPWAGYFDFWGLFFLTFKLKELKWWSFKSLPGPSILSFHSLVFFFPLLFLCDSHKVLLLLHKEDKRDKIQTSISAVFWLPTRWQF